MQDIDAVAEQAVAEAETEDDKARRALLADADDDDNSDDDVDDNDDDDDDLSDEGVCAFIVSEVKVNTSPHVNVFIFTVKRKYMKTN